MVASSVKRIFDYVSKMADGQAAKHFSCMYWKQQAKHCTRLCPRIFPLIDLFQNLLAPREGALFLDQLSIDFSITRRHDQAFL